MTTIRLAAASLFSAAAICAALAVFSSAATADETPGSEAPAKPATGDVQVALTTRIDAEIAKVWERDGVIPAPRSGDEAFLRRVYLDTVGVPPTPAEIQAFAADESSTKRSGLISRLVADPRFGRNIADLWVPILLGRTSKNKGGMDHVLATWLARQINAGTGFDRIIFDMVTATGKMSDNPAVAYWGSKDEQFTPDFAGLASKHFTGVQIQCAQCHKHPYEQMTMEDFAGAASFFLPLQIGKSGDKPYNPEVKDARVSGRGKKIDAEQIKKLDEKQRRKLEERLKYSNPKYLYGDTAKIEDGTLWRAAWAKWALAPTNKQTQRYLANRFWSFIFAQGIVNPVDDFNSFNQPTHPDLLDALASELLASKYDVRLFYRAVLNTSAYQLSSSGGSRSNSTGPESWHYAAYPVKQLSPEQFFGALLGLTSDPAALKEARQKGGNTLERIRKEAELAAQKKAKAKEMEGEDSDEKPKEKGARPEKKKEEVFDLDALDKLEALYNEMPDEWILRRQMCSTYASRSSDDEMLEADGFTLSIDQALQVMNGAVTSKLSVYKKGLPLFEVLNESKDPETRAKSLYLRVLSRSPSPTESKRTLDYVAQAMRDGSSIEKAWEDVLFALMMTTEFATNH